MKKQANNSESNSFINTDAELNEKVIETVSAANEAENFTPDKEEDFSEHHLDDKKHDLEQYEDTPDKKAEDAAKLAELRAAKASAASALASARAKLKAAQKSGNARDIEELSKAYDAADLASREADAAYVEAKMDIQFQRAHLKEKPELRDQGIILSVRHLKMFFKLGSWPDYVKLKAVHDISFDVKEKETFGIVGESGCGKSTTGRCIMHLYDITSGSIYYRGYRIGAGDRWNKKEIKYSKIHTKNRINALNAELNDRLAGKPLEEGTEYLLKVNATDPEALKQAYQVEIESVQERNNEVVAEQVSKIRRIHHDNRKTPRKLLNEIQMIFQDPVDSLDPRMTVEDIIQEGLRIQGHRNAADNHKKTVDILEKVGLVPEHASRYPHEFSGGQRQRIGIARALIMNPKILICDEPISALDVSIRAQIINLLNDLKEEMGITMIFIAHDLSTVKYFCDRIAVMYYGNMVELATSDELFKHPLHPYTKSLLSAIPQPNPLSEKRRKRMVYNPMTTHDYSKEKPTFREILPGHFVLCNTAEFEAYQKEIAEIDKKK